MKLYSTILKEVIDVNEKLWEDIPEQDKKRALIVSKALKENKIPNPWELKTLPNIEEEKTKDIKIYFDEEEDEDIILKKELDLQKILKYTYESIEFLTEDNDKLIISSEMKTRYGRIDIKAQSKKTCHAIELKLNKADHKIVGQIMKYMRNLGSKLHLGLYEDVEGITVAESYSENALKDLKLLGVKTFTYSMNKNKIKLTKI